jgi:hypothetical protein
MRVNAESTWSNRCRWVAAETLGRYVRPLTTQRNAPSQLVEEILEEHDGVFLHGRLRGSRR